MHGCLVLPGLPCCCSDKNTSGRARETGKADIGVRDHMNEVRWSGEGDYHENCTCACEVDTCR